MPFRYTLENEDGSPADPPTLTSVIPHCHPGDRILLGPGHTLRILELRTAKNPEFNVVLL